MANRLDRYKDQIELLRANGESIRGISAKLSEMSGERIPPSSIHNWLKANNGVQQPLALVNGTDYSQEQYDEVKGSTGVQHEAPNQDGEALDSGGVDRVEIRLRRVEKEVEEAGLWIAVLVGGIATHIIWEFVGHMKAFALMGVCLAIGLAAGWGLRIWKERRDRDA